MRQLWKKWVEALRSGSFKQTSRMMYNEDTGGYCCLGVLHKIATGRNSPEGILTHFQAERYGLCGEGGEIDDYRLPDDHPFLGKYKSLADMNDSGVSFDVIADFIEQYPEAIKR